MAARLSSVHKCMLDASQAPPCIRLSAVKRPCLLEVMYGWVELEWLMHVQPISPLSQLLCITYQTVVRAHHTCTPSSRVRARSFRTCQHRGLVGLLRQAQRFWACV